MPQFVDRVFDSGGRAPLEVFAHPSFAFGNALLDVFKVNYFRIDQALLIRLGNIFEGGPGRKRHHLTNERADYRFILSIDCLPHLLLETANRIIPREAAVSDKMDVGLGRLPANVLVQCPVTNQGIQDI